MKKVRYYNTFNAPSERHGKIHQVKGFTILTPNDMQRPIIIPNKKLIKIDNV